MTGVTWALVGLAVAWIAWLVRVYQVIKRADDQRELADADADAEDARRRDALGYVTRLDSLRRLDRTDRISRTGRR